MLVAALSFANASYLVHNMWSYALVHFDV